VTRISHAEFSAAQQDFTRWWQAKQSPPASGRRLGYAQVVKLSIYRFHKEQGNRDVALAHFDQLVAGRLTNAQKIYRARLQLESYADWHEGSGVIVADHRVRLSLPLGNDVMFGGEISRVDVVGTRYRGVLLMSPISRNWQQETRMRLIQLAVARKYERQEEDVSVAVQLLDGNDLNEVTFDSGQLGTALEGANRIAERIRRALRRHR
jgi:hypothetical protein